MNCLNAKTLTKKSSIKQSIIEDVSNMISEGILNKGDVLPSIRSMSDKYHISRGSVVMAYKALESLGYIIGRERICYQVVGNTPKKELSTRHQGNTFISEEASVANTVADRSDTDICRKLELQAGTLPSHFARKWFATLPAGKTLAVSSVQYQAELSALKESFCRVIKMSRGTQIDAQNMLLQPGQQEAILLIAQYGKLKSPHPTVILEDPCSPKVVQLFTSLGYNIIRVGVNEDGMDTSSLPDHPVDFIYTSPTHQFPSGATMSQERRAALLQWAERYNALIVENDSCALLGFGSDVTPTLSDRYPNSRIVYLSSTAELSGSNVNLSFVIAPEEMLASLKQLQKLLFSDVQPMISGTLSLFMNSNYFITFLSKNLQLRRQKYRLALEGLQRAIDVPAVWGQPQAGFFSFADKHKRLPPEVVKNHFFDLSLFYTRADQNQDTRYIYPLAAFSLDHIEKINQQLLS
jgi:DNA-binding transcriptional MocR family regulator